MVSKERCEHCGTPKPGMMHGSKIHRCGSKMEVTAPIGDVRYASDSDRIAISLQPTIWAIGCHQYMIA
jgi:hypothetical protein